MKILFTRFPLESTYGGAEVQTMSLMKGLIERGHAVAFLGSCPTLLRLCREEGIPVAELAIGPPPVTKWHALSFFWRQTSMRQRLIRAFDQFCPSVIGRKEGILSGVEGHDINVVCMLSLSEKLLLTEHAVSRNARIFWIEHDRVGPWLTKNPWLKKVLRTSTYTTTVCVSDLSRKIYIELGWSPENTMAIANGVDGVRVMSERNIASNSKLKTQSLTLRIGTIARLTHDKGIDLLIEAVAAIPNASLSIIGQGQEEETLRTCIQAKHGTGRITIKSNVNDLAAFYRSLDVFVLPSREHDPFGLVAAEAMLCGIPTIVTDACGIAGYLKNGTDAIIVRANDADALRDAIRKLSDANIRDVIAQSGRKIAQEKFSLERMVDEYERTLR